jgi:hypothetical protein
MNDAEFLNKKQVPAIGSENADTYGNKMKKPII